jgi:phage terminase Nu1 subunit (DNA packaging protein)
MRVNRVQFCSIFGCTKHEFDALVAEGMPAQKAGAGRGAGWAVDTIPAYKWLVERELRAAGVASDMVAAGNSNILDHCCSASRRPRPRS